MPLSTAYLRAPARAGARKTRQAGSGDDIVALSSRSPHPDRLKKLSCRFFPTTGDWRKIGEPKWIVLQSGHYANQHGNRTDVYR
ncbi:hypothetical protein FBY13_103286 [Pantoea sp. SJZ147]|nr:hypothetical protein FBY13_103286 [Pantoea sp. SJZ147]